MGTQDSEASQPGLSEIDFTTVQTPFLSFLQDKSDGFNPWTPDRAHKRGDQAADLYIKLRDSSRKLGQPDKKLLEGNCEKLIAVEGSMGDWERAEQAFSFYDTAVKHDVAGLVGEQNLYESMRDAYKTYLAKNSPPEIAGKYRSLLPSWKIGFFKWLAEKQKTSSSS